MVRIQSLETVVEPGTVTTLSFPRPEPAKHVSRERLPEPPPIAELRRRRPRLLLRPISGDIPAAG